MEHLVENEPIERNNNNINININANNDNNNINQVGEINNINNINQAGEINNNNNNNIQNIENNVQEQNNNLNNIANPNNEINNQNNAIPPQNPQNNVQNNIQNNIQNNEEQQGGGFNFANFNFNNLNYNRFRHVLHTHELEFLLNQKYSKSLWEIICTLTFTKVCHKISFFVLFILFFCILYLLVIKHYNNSSIILKLESEDSYFEIIIWMVNIFIIIICWNFHMFLFSTLFKYDYSKTVNNIRSSFVEEFYKNPIGFILLLFYIDTSNLKNAIDDSFWVLIELMYFIIFYNLNQFFTQFYKELMNITDFKTQKNNLKKVNLISLFFIMEATILILFNYIIIQAMNSFHKFIFLSKGVYLFYKIIEIWKIYFDEYKYCEHNMDTREKYFFKNFRTKSFLELGGMVYVFIQFCSCFIMGDSTIFYFNIVVCYFIFVLGFQISSYFKKYKELTEYLYSLDRCLESAEIKEDKECVICTEKMTNCRKLSCNHYFHLICLSKWFENAHNSCPICRTEIKFDEKVKNIIKNRININNNYNNDENANSIFPFNINTNLFSWLPNNSLRIIRFINNNENNNGVRNNVNIIVNNPNVNRININIQRRANNQEVPGQNQNHNHNQ